jgi:hypothetical protein
MLKLLKRLFCGATTATSDNCERALKWQRELQSLRLEVQDRERAIATLKEDLDRLRRSEIARLETAMQGERERFLAAAAVSVAQLLTQAHLLEVDGRPIPARDILSVARRLVRLLENEGLGVEGRIGESVSFDPDRHDPIGSSSEVGPGFPVILRIPGVLYRGKILLKAGVDKAGD